MTWLRDRGGRRRFRAIILAVLCSTAMFPVVGAAQSMPGRASTPETGGGASRARARALALSLVCPGLGHLQMGRSGRAAPFLLVETGLWTTFLVSTVQGSWRRDSYVEMAQLDASVRASGRQSDSYYRLIGAWPSSDSYNELIRREARAVHPDDLEGRAAYFAANRVPDEIAWSWESQAAWDRYRDKRNESRRAYRRARNMLGLAVANRVVAMIDATLLAHRGGGAGALRLEMVPRGELGAAAVQMSLSIP